MANLTKYTIISDLKSYFSTRRTKRRTFSLAFCFVFVIIFFTTFLAFIPLNSSSPWFTYILTTTTITTTSSTLVPYSLNMSNSNNDREKTLDDTEVLKPNDGLQEPVLKHIIGALEKDNSTTFPDANKTVDSNISTKTLTWHNQSESEHLHEYVENVGLLKGNGSITGITNSRRNVTVDGEEVTGKNLTSYLVTTKQVNGEGNGSITGITNSRKNVTVDGEKATGKNLTSSIEMTKLDNGTNVVKKKHGNGTHVKKKKRRNGTNVATMKQNNSTNAEKKKRRSDDLIKDLMNCDLFEGDWVKDDSYPLYKQGSCSLVDEQFNCFLNGRPDNDYQKLKWKPKGCTLPRLDGSHMLELLRGKRLVFVGDSLNRNMWESLVCVLKNSVKDQKKVYEQNGSYKFRTKASFSFVFEEYNARVEFYVSPFLVEQWETTDKNGTTKETLRLDLVSSLAAKYRDADILVFNTAHWWNRDKTFSGKNYFQEGSNLYKKLNVHEAFRKGLTTWGRWVDANVNPKKSLVLFRGFSAAHFSGGQWNSGGQCHNETGPITEEKYLVPYPRNIRILENVLRGMKTHVTYLNVTKMTDYRKDGHPSIYRFQNKSEEEKKSPWKIHQDCSHWCLPGVPDAWNEILYTQLLVKMYHKQQ